jgi:hypothetical protein
VAAGRVLVLLVALVPPAGCGTSRFTDTTRTATEQLLISNAVDEAVSQMNFQALAHKPVYLDAQYLSESPDRGYVISTLRQHLLAHGCLLMEDRRQAQYVVEARCGGIGTDRHDLLFGIPQTQLPSVPGVPTPSVIPEIPFAKKTEQKGVAKIAVFAYNRTTGHPLWQSGTVQKSSTSKDLWLLGAGPFRQGSIRKNTEFATGILHIPFYGNEIKQEVMPPGIPVTQPVIWEEPGEPEEPEEPLILLGEPRPGSLGLKE